MSEKPTFEQSMDRLDQIVFAVERNEIALEQAIGLFEEGLNLVQDLDTQLQGYENKGTGTDAAASAERKSGRKLMMNEFEAFLQRQCRLLKRSEVSEAMEYSLMGRKTAPSAAVVRGRRGLWTISTSGLYGCRSAGNDAYVFPDSRRSAGNG